MIVADADRRRQPTRRAGHRRRAGRGGRAARPGARLGAPGLPRRRPSARVPICRASIGREPGRGCCSRRTSSSSSSRVQLLASKLGPRTTAVRANEASTASGRRRRHRGQPPLRVAGILSSGWPRWSAAGCPRPRPSCPAPAARSSDRTTMTGPRWSFSRPARGSRPACCPPRPGRCSGRRTSWSGSPPSIPCCPTCAEADIPVEVASRRPRALWRARWSRPTEPAAVVWLVAADGDPASACALGELAAAGGAPELEMLPGLLRPARLPRCSTWSR